MGRRYLGLRHYSHGSTKSLAIGIVHNGFERTPFTMRRICEKSGNFRIKRQRGAHVDIMMPQSNAVKMARRDVATDRLGDTAPRGMVFGMATRKLTITLGTEQVAAVQKLVRKGRAKSLSGFVQHAVGVAIDDAAGWGTMLVDALNASGGALDADESAWVDAAYKKVSSRGTKTATARARGTRRERVRKNAA
jgi:Arc/MetJ-type ribon-helix-helix transcriptional regulator